MLVPFPPSPAASCPTASRARCCRAYLQVERRHIAGSDELSAPQLADVSEARKDVEAALRHRLSQAVRSRDHAAVLATLPMMRAVGIAAEGSAAFTTYVQDLVRNRVRDDYGAHPSPPRFRTSQILRSVTAMATSSHLLLVSQRLWWKQWRTQHWASMPTLQGA